MHDFRGRRALVTGSTQGVGLAIAESLAQQGCHLALHGKSPDRSADDALKICRSHGVEADIFFEDLACNQPQSVCSLSERVLDKGPIDFLICNAGTYIDQPFLEMEFERLDQTMKLNVYSYFLLVQRIAQEWVAKGTDGRVVLVGSINGRLAEDVHVAYDASKGAVEMMVKSMAVSLARHGIRVNGMAPGLVETPLTSPALRDAQFRRWMEHHTPNGKVPGPDACASAVSFLLSDEAWHVHGQMILVDGGMSCWQQPDPEP